jgi:omega-6 fatty acid desaturase (delta-12 desaturase)
LAFADESSRPVAATRELAGSLMRFRDPNPRRSSVEIFITAVPLIALWIMMWGSLALGYWLCLLLAVPAAGFLVRLFMIQHDCSHGALFRSRRANDWVGRVIGVITLTPYDHWRQTHAEHHAGTGNLDRRGIGDVYTMTVSEYAGLGRRQRLMYRLYRHPLALFGIGPAYLFFLQHRVPRGMMRKGWRPWFTTMATNAAIIALSGVLVWLIGLGAFIAVHLPVATLAASAGVWLFYVQHQFEDTYWKENEAWTHAQASLTGSSFYDLPAPLRWLTANIGVHHVHHLNSRIPFYRLSEVMRAHPELGSIGRLTLARSFSCVRLALWDEGRNRLISFREMRINAAAELSGQRPDRV